MTAYADPSDLVNRLELPTIQRLISDDGHDVPEEDLATDDKLLAALEDASGDVEAAMLVGKRYSVEDLERLTGNSLATLKRITCTIALAYLLERRPTVHLEQSQRYLERAQQYLEQLRAGARIFNVEDNVGKQTPTIDGPRSVDYERMNGIVDQMSHRYFPNRISRLPTNRG